MKSGRKITEGGVLLAFYSVLLLITLYLPLIGGVSFFFLPIPFILMTIKHSIPWSFGFLFIAGVLTLILGAISIPLTLLMGLMGITIGYCLKREQPFIMLFVNTVLVVLGVILAILGGAVWILKVNLIEKFFDIADASMAQSTEILESFGQTISKERLENVNDMFEMMNTLLPTLLVLASVIIVILFFLVSQPFIKRFSTMKIQWPLFRELQLPKSLLWYYLLTMVLTLVVNPEKTSFMYLALVNLMFILQILILLQGYSLVFYFAHIKKWPKVIPYLVLVGSFILPIVQSIVRILGIIDLGFPFRQSIAKKKE